MPPNFIAPQRRTLVKEKQCLPHRTTEWKHLPLLFTTSPRGEGVQLKAGSRGPHPAWGCPDFPTAWSSAHAPGHMRRAPQGQGTRPHQANCSPRGPASSGMPASLSLKHNSPGNFPDPVASRLGVPPCSDRSGYPVAGRKHGTSGRPGKSALPSQTLTLAGEGLKGLENTQP